MSELTFRILGKGKKTVAVEANIEGTLIKFFGVNLETYLKRMRTYQAPSKRHALLSWLTKNCTHNDDVKPAPPVPKQNPLPQSLRPVAKAAPKSAPMVITNGQMVLEVEKRLLAKGYTLVKKGTTIPMTTCSHITKKDGKVVDHGCGKESMIGAFKELPAPKFIGVCYHRYNPGSSCEVVKVWKAKDARAWLAKQKAA